MGLIEDTLYRVEETRQLDLLYTLHSQQDQQERHAEINVDFVYDAGDEVLVWTPLRQPKPSQKLLKAFSGPFAVLQHIVYTNYEVAPVLLALDRRTKAKDIDHVA